MDQFDAALLARIQFGFTIGFHILFPTFTIGIAGFLLVVEALWLKIGDAAWRRIYGFWVRLFALAFGMGVVSGVVLSYQFGTQAGNIVLLFGPSVQRLSPSYEDYNGRAMASYDLRFVPKNGNDELRLILL